MKSPSHATRILCVDDEPAMLDMYCRILAHGNPARAEAEQEVQALEEQLFGKSRTQQLQPSFNLVTCSQGDDAVEIVRQAIAAGEPLPVAFLDMRMPPGLDGVETAERIRALDSEIALVFVTAYSDVDPQQIAERVACSAGGLYYLQKPAHRCEVWQLASALSSAWQTRRELRHAHMLLEEANIQLRHDIAKRTRIERELEARKRELEGLFYTLSHDLCAPVVSITGFTTLLAENYADCLDETGTKFLERLQVNLSALTMMLNGARGLSEAIRESGSRSSVAVADAVDEATRRLADLIEQTGTTITLEDELPRVVYPREGLVQVFSQLIENGIRYAQEGVSPCIAITCEHQTNFDRFYVRDNGIGIPSSFRQRIFEAFVRLQPDKTPGAGVGLAVVRRIVEDNGGRLELRAYQVREAHSGLRYQSNMIPAPQR